MNTIETIDFHTHLAADADIELQQRLSQRDVRTVARTYVDRLDNHGIDHAVAIVMDEEFLYDPDAVADLLEVRENTDRFSLVFLLDPLDEEFPELVDRATEAGAVGVKFHPYLQEFGAESESATLRRAFERVADSDLLTIIDTNYAGESLFRYNGVRLAHMMARTVSSPIVLAHAGNARILDAFAVARFADNVWLDTSFTLPYWIGSSVGRDFAFCMEKLRMSRWVWGSDTPSLDPSRCRSEVRSFLRDHSLKKWEQDLFADNARKLLTRGSNGSTSL